MKMRLSYLLLSVVVVFLLVGHAPITMSVTCNAANLSSCASAMLTGSQPSATCCNKLREQRPCLCQYLKDPNLQKFIKPENARKVATTCNVPYPNC
ncbi:non-specific lipid-transfer protein 2-like [Magnolia sinica]|uniref:non-specific lipid-transfer protein 2-like n=1 Tax=Magnolia sinica TaxID=86752 RepID=UPI0026588F7B|nr:non-specific lipid-transfer protein 2-like [Magnolia sinica]